MLEFKCEMCQGIFLSELTEEDAVAEMIKTFGDHSKNFPVSTVCDDCHKRLMGMFN